MPPHRHGSWCLPIVGSFAAIVFALLTYTRSQFCALVGLFTLH